MTPHYELDCTDCSFRTAVIGEFRDALDVVESHRQEADLAAHFVNVHRRNWAPPRSPGTEAGASNRAKGTDPRDSR